MHCCACFQAEERHVEVLGSLLYAAKIVAKQEGLDDGFRIVINDGPKGSEYRFTDSNRTHLVGALVVSTDFCLLLLRSAMGLPPPARSSSRWTADELATGMS
jgi:hypothetical protein